MLGRAYLLSFAFMAAGTEQDKKRREGGEPRSKLRKAHVAGINSSTAGRGQVVWFKLRFGHEGSCYWVEYETQRVHVPNS